MTLDHFVLTRRHNDKVYRISEDEQTFCGERTTLVWCSKHTMHENQVTSFSDLDLQNFDTWYCTEMYWGRHWRQCTETKYLNNNVMCSFPPLNHRSRRGNKCTEFTIPGYWTSVDQIIRHLFVRKFWKHY